MDKRFNVDGIFGINVFTSILVISVITTIYTVLGGLKAVVVTESVQTVILILGAVVLTGFAMAGFVHHHYPDIRIVAGGGLISSWMSSPAWSEPFKGLIDMCISGPGEKTLLQLFGKDPGSGLGRFCYDGFALSDYLSPGVVLPYAASHGCYWQKCQFCPDFAEGSCYITSPASETLSEIDNLTGNLDPVLVHLLDNAVSPALLRELGDSGLTVPWYGFARFEKDLEIHLLLIVF